ncbi:MAG: hypothetical protein OXC63_06165 [Aestuariivita sp.]|nr:hypothetical protein [Aestuariivita sp.]
METGLETFDSGENFGRFGYGYRAQYQYDHWITVLVSERVQGDGECPWYYRPWSVRNH